MRIPAEFPSFSPDPRGLTVLKKRLFPLLAPALCAGFLHFSGCAGGTESGNPTLAGGTETGNPTAAKVRGRVVDSTGTPKESVSVRLLPVSYNPVIGAIAPDSMTALTDSAGHYEIAITITNYYRLTGLDPASRAQVFRSSIAVLDSGVIQAGIDTLAAPGAISATLSPATVTGLGYLYVPGTSIAVKVLQPGVILMDSVPAGRMPVLYYDSLARIANSPGQEYRNVAVVSGDTVLIRDDAPVTGGVTVTGVPGSITYSTFDFVPLNFMGIPFISILSMNGPDTLAIVLYSMFQPNSTVDLRADSVFFLAGSLDSLRFAFYNTEADSLNPTGFISGGFLFTAFDTGSVISGTFLSGSTLIGINRTDTSKFPMTVTGSFTANRAK